MNKVINPKFESYDVMTEWGLEGVSNWWAKDIEVHIRDMQNEGGVLQNYEVGEVFSLLVCSPDFKRRPNSEFTADDLSKALVLDRYDKDEVKAYLKKKINSIGAVNVEVFDQKFRTLFNMSDWDQTTGKTH